MSDRSSAEIFGLIFEVLAKPGRFDRKKAASVIWRNTGNFDFSPYQMDCDDSLIALGLATKCKCGGIKYEGEDDAYHKDRTDCNE